MRSARPPRMRRIGLPRMRRCVIAAAALLASAAPALAGGVQNSLSPGPLATDHAAFESKCSLCHVPFEGVPNDRCLACHKPLARKIADNKGFHATLGTEPCVRCHKDHRGRDFPLSPPPGASFDHRRTDFPLYGQHLEIPCASCHPKNARGATQWTGISHACADCHPDTHHHGALGPRCGECHSAAAWIPPTRTRKDHKVGMNGGHRSLTCANCHTRGANLRSTTSCQDCHTQGHGGTARLCVACHSVAGWKVTHYDHSFCTCKLPGVHQTAPCLSCHAGFHFKNTPFACSACHEKDRKHEPLGQCSLCHSALSWKKRIFNHNRRRFHFPITGQHLGVACTGCHPQAGKFREASTKCAGCHAVPAHGDFGACDKCHTTKAWSPSFFDHDSTRFPLRGAHVNVACQKCHANLAPGSFHPGPGECVTCHKDPHGGQFHSAHAAGEMFPGGARRRRRRRRAAADLFPRARGRRRLHCIDCHTQKAWTPSKIDVSAHAHFSFPLKGVHARIACKSCHRHGQFVDTPTACLSCHLDSRHNGKLGTHCERCHNPTSWKSVPPFKHAKETGFALDHGHAGLKCKACHGADGRRLSKLSSPVSCAACHSARHGLQFGTHCTSCHNTTSFSQTPPFDHSTTDFPLKRRHRVLACEACHDVRKRPRINRHCQTCHGDPHRASNGYECQDCHRADRWRVIRFDHDRTDFPLIGRHFTASCSECHVNPGWTGVRAQCFTCHADDRPATQNHATLLACGKCHTPYSWRLIKR